MAEALRDQFARDGVVRLNNVLSSQWIDLLAQGVAENLAAPGPMASDYVDDADGRYFGDYCNWQRIPGYRKFAEDGPLGEIAAELMGSPIVRMFHEHVLIKEPHTSMATPWHHDQPYYCMQGEQNVSFWISLDPVSAQTCPRFLAGSHRDPGLFVPRLFKSGEAYPGTDGAFKPLDDLDIAEDSPDIRFWPMEVGDVVAFHFKTLHNAPANLTDHRRRVISMRYLGEDCRYAERPFRPSPPYPEMGLELSPGDSPPEDWFPTVWPAS